MVVTVLQEIGAPIVGGVGDLAGLAFLQLVSFFPDQLGLLRVAGDGTSMEQALGSAAGGAGVGSERLVFGAAAVA
jgi:hypothetical protein